ncbi:MAG: hypothetical protein C4294_18115 [Nitrospiraceae bacterium]
MTHTQEFLNDLAAELFAQTCGSNVLRQLNRAHLVDSGGNLRDGVALSAVNFTLDQNALVAKFAIIASAGYNVTAISLGHSGATYREYFRTPINAVAAKKGTKVNVEWRLQNVLNFVPRALLEGARVSRCDVCVTVLKRLSGLPGGEKNMCIAEVIYGDGCNTVAFSRSAELRRACHGYSTTTTDRCKNPYTKLTIKTHGRDTIVIDNISRWRVVVENVDILSALEIALRAPPGQPPPPPPPPPGGRNLSGSATGFYTLSDSATLSK